jgi:hypothetical protein
MYGTRYKISKQALCISLVCCIFREDVQHSLQNIKASFIYFARLLYLCLTGEKPIHSQRNAKAYLARL